MGMDLGGLSLSGHWNFVRLGISVCNSQEADFLRMLLDGRLSEVTFLQAFNLDSSTF